MIRASLDTLIRDLLEDASLCQNEAAARAIVSGMTVQKDGSLLVRCLTDEPFPVDWVCQLEKHLEQTLSVREVIVCQSFPSPLDEQASCRYAIEMAPWLVRHVWKKDALTASLLKQARFHEKDNRVIIQFEDARCALISNDKLKTMETCFQDYIGARVVFALAPAERAHEEGSLTDYARQMHDKNNVRANEKHLENHNGSSGHLSASAAVGERPAPQNHDQQTRRSGRFRRGRQEGVLWGKINRDLERVPIESLNNETGLALIEGYVFDLDVRTVSQGTRVLFKFNLTDRTSSVSCILFTKPAQRDFLEEKLNGAYVCLSAEVSFDVQYSRDLQARVTGVAEARQEPLRRDSEPERRIELHAHTKMSAKDAVCDPGDLVRLAAQMGHEAVAITDHGVVQAFPEAASARAQLEEEGQSIKVIFGMEGYLVDDHETVVWMSDQASLDHGYVALDVETTGLDPAKDRVIEVAAVRFDPDKEGSFMPGESFVQLVNPGVPVPDTITRLTGIDNTMIADAPDPMHVLRALVAWIGDRPVVAHNAFFDLDFLRYEGFRTPTESDPAIKFNPTVIDTLALSRVMLPKLKNHRLSTVASYFSVDLRQAHRARADALACGTVFARLFEQAGVSSLKALNQIVGHVDDAAILDHKRPVFHIILLAADRLGLYHLYRIVSASHLRYFHSRPRIPRHILRYFSSGLIIGSACEAGEIFQYAREAYLASGQSVEKALLRLNSPSLRNKARLYDYFEIQPVGNNAFYLRDPDSRLTEESDLYNLNRLILAWGKKLKKPVCATGDVHFLEPSDAEFRRILMTDMGFSDAEHQADLYFRTTREMLDAFDFLGPEDARAVVIENPKRMASRVSDHMKPFPDGSFPPHIASAPDEVIRMTWGQARALYQKNDELPDLVRQRIERELKSIIDNGFAVMYYIAQKLVKKSNEDGYIVGSRGSVGSSLVATLCGITEVNPLPPHYRCPVCRTTIFDQTGSYGSGYDLPEKRCPACQAVMDRDGQDIPFETFLGFDGDKQPDIDLNFSGEYQPRAHQFIEEMFGSKQTYRAGTISSYAERNAQAIVRKYFEQQDRFVTQAEISRLSRGLIGVKRTTGQHPGGIVIVPEDREIYDFTPVQHPADNRINGTITTHFDFNAMHDTILKLDILGHDDPTMLKMLGDLTGVRITDIPVPDPAVMSLFQSAEALGIPDDLAPDHCATLGLPEMGTFMARDMIRETKPSRFYDLVQLMGLSHGTDVWKGNAQDLIRSGTCTIEDVIGCRDSIMTWLIYKGLTNKDAFDITERVRKGRGLTQEQENMMREHEVPDWYITSCKKIRYMFPKAHAVAYTLSALRIAWFKIHYPEAYYCAYFTVRADEFDSTIMCLPKEEIRRSREKRRREFRKSTDREQRIYYIIELIEEMQLRGIDFVPVDLHQSAATHFIQVGPKAIRPPLNTVPSISLALATQIVRAREQGPFKTRDELMQRAGIGQSALESLERCGCLDQLPKSRQIDLFEWME